MRIFGWDKLFSVFNSPMFASLPDDEPLAQSGMLTKRVTWVQKQVEWHNFDVRKHILEYDDVINKHRNIIYSRRNKILDSENIHEDIRNMIENQISTLVTAEFSKNENISKSSNNKIIKKVNEFLWIDALNDKIEIDDISWISNPEELSKYISNIAFEEFESLKRDAASENEYLNLERRIVLSSIDELWMRHIDAMSKLREEVAFEWYSGKNPLTVYKEKAYYKFRDLINEIEYKVVKAIFSIKKIEQVEQIDLSKENFELNEVNLDETTKIKEKINPLFNKINNGNIKKIRV